MVALEKTLGFNPDSLPHISLNHITGTDVIGALVGTGIAAAFLYLGFNVRRRSRGNIPPRQS